MPSPLCCGFAPFRAARVSVWLHWHRSRFFGLAFAIGTFITIAYFSLVLPLTSGLTAEGWAITMFEHALTGIFIWTELLLVPHSFGPWPLESLIVIVYAIVYLVWNVVTYTQNGIWPYNFQNALSGPAGCLYIVLVTLVWLCYLLGRVLARCRWPEHNADHNGCCCRPGGCRCQHCVYVRCDECVCCGQSDELLTDQSSAPAKTVGGADAGVQIAVRSAAVSS
jgi:hypothetical protein